MRVNTIRGSIYFLIIFLIISSFSGCKFFKISDEIPGRNTQGVGSGDGTNTSGNPNYSGNILELKLRIGSEIMTINGRSRIMDVVPVIKNEITLVPIKFVTEAFNISAYWMPETRQVRIVEGAKEFFLTVDSSMVIIGTEEYTLASPPEIIDGRTFVPLRFVSESLGAKVEWNNDLREITITR